MSAPSVIERVKTTLVALKMPRALEVLDVTLRGIERGEIGAVEAIDALLTEELTTRENRRVRMAVQMARLSAIKTLAGFDFAFQPSLDRNRILALAGLQFINRAEAVHLIGPPGTGKTHLSLALGVEAVSRTADDGIDGNDVETDIRRSVGPKAAEPKVIVDAAIGEKHATFCERAIFLERQRLVESRKEEWVGG